MFLSRDAHDGIRLFCAANAVSVAGFLEALGLHLAALDKPGTLRTVIEEGRVVDAERRSR